MATNFGKIGPAVVFGIVAVAVLGGLLWRQSTTRAIEQIPSATLENNEPHTAASNVPARMPAAPQPVAPRRQFSQAERLKIGAERNRRREEMSDRVSGSNAALAARHRGERVDPQWAAGMETRLQEVSQVSSFKDSGVIPTTLEIDCKATTCKIDAGLASRSLGDDWAMLYMSSVGSNVKRAYTSVITAPDGTSHVVIYAIAR